MADPEEGLFPTRRQLDPCWMAWTANASTEVAARVARVVKRTTEEIIVLRLRGVRLVCERSMM